jgi:hypothetical protein
MLADAVDEKKRLALIDLLIEERAKERLEEQLAADRVATTTRNIAAVLSISRDWFPAMAKPAQATAVRLVELGLKAKGK